MQIGIHDSQSIGTGKKRGNHNKNTSLKRSVITVRVIYFILCRYFRQRTARRRKFCYVYYVARCFLTLQHKHI